MSLFYCLFFNSQTIPPMEKINAKAVQIINIENIIFAFI